MDTLKPRLQASCHSEIHNMFYNGWTHDHYVSGVFVLSPARLVIACALNAHGCMHDSQIAEQGNVYAKIQRLYPSTGGQVVVDSTFSQCAYDFLLKRWEDVVLPMAVRRQVISLRQTTGLVMRALQAALSRYRTDWNTRREENGSASCTQRTRIVGINQFYLRFTLVVPIERLIHCFWNLPNELLQKIDLQLTRGVSSPKLPL